MTLRLNAVPLFHPYLSHSAHSVRQNSKLFPQFSRETDPAVPSKAYPPLVQVTNLNIKHHFKVPLPWLGTIFDARLPKWPGMRAPPPENETVPSSRHWSDVAKQDAPELTIATGMGGKLVQLTPQVSSDSLDVEEESNLRVCTYILHAPV